MKRKKAITSKTLLLRAAAHARTPINKSAVVQVTASGLKSTLNFRGGNRGNSGGSSIFSVNGGV